jgi:hypothetical protein
MAGAFDKAFSLNLTLQILRRDLGSKRIYAGVESHHGQE